MFLYRHAIETALKAVLIEAGEPEAKVLKRDHKLTEQMPDLRKVGKRQHFPISAHLENVIKRWNGNDGDPHGVGARYPIDKKTGKPILIKNDRRFHLRPFVEDAERVLEELYELLEHLEFVAYQKFLTDEGICN